MTAAEKAFDEAYRKVRAGFETLPNGVPLRVDPAIASALDALGDPAGAYGTPAFPASLEFNACGKVNEIVTRYLHASEGGAPPSLPRNQQRFEIELRPLGTFSTRCFARTLDALNRASRAEVEEARRRYGLVVDADLDPRKPEARNFDIRRRRMEDVWRAAAQALMTLPVQAAGGSSSESYRRQLVASTGREAATLGAALPIDKRAETLQLMERFAALAPDWAKPDIDKARAALKDKSCTGLCARSAAE